MYYNIHREYTQHTNSHLYTRYVETPAKQKIRDIPPTAVRLAPEVRHALAREAAINGRSLHAEIVLRLRKSLGVVAGDDTPPTEHAVRDTVAGAYFTQALADSERAMLAVFRGMSPEKQLALLSLFK